MKKEREGGREEGRKGGGRKGEREGGREGSYEQQAVAAKCQAGDSDGDAVSPL